MVVAGWRQLARQHADADIVARTVGRGGVMEQYGSKNLQEQAGWKEDDADAELMFGNGTQY